MLPIELQGANNRVVLSFLRERGGVEGSVEVQRVKVMLVGPGGAGK